LLHFDDRMNEIYARSFRTGLPTAIRGEEHPILLLTPSSVEGFIAIAERRRRVGRTKSASKPARMQSPADRLGDRCRERFTRSWCFRRSDSATRERTPPGPGNRASVAIKWITRTARLRIEE
jgi:hypothetical protein